MKQKHGRAAVFDGYGDGAAVSVADVPRPAPGPGEVLVEIVATGVSHMDLYVRQGRFQDVVPLSFPARQGSSFAGLVRARGDGVPARLEGAAVLGHDPAHGAHADHIVIAAGAVVPKPDRVTWEVGGALYLTGVTAFRLVQQLRLSAEDTVVVSAAAGGVGHIECQLAHLAGARVIGIAGSENHDYLRSIGVRPVGYGDSLRADIDRLADGSPVTALLDNYGGYEQLAADLGVSAGRVLTSERRRAVEVELYLAPASDAGAAVDLRDVAQLVADWNVRMLVSGFYNLDDLQIAMRDLDSGHSRGVVVLGTHTSASSATYRQAKLRDRYRGERPASSVR